MAEPRTSTSATAPDAIDERAIALTARTWRRWHAAAATGTEPTASPVADPTDTAIDAVVDALLAARRPDRSR